ncbi:hypothetical protein J9253_02760 [Thiothrix litoralis]|jgi:type IV pilus assembly protein PilY1|uniref:PilY1 beta-propeller domain-containing protein n=1 Tax=Thiothrix litoralis TaxID=2891210 RepID=A0ABX7WSN4_9GAMM|nr:PilC/PilY family type IV pilus protein [Thiothrix litoralis]QTR46886.1 hypothetical protein J9253_02760 [Thiothrix litoralis]
MIHAIRHYRPQGWKRLASLGIALFLSSASYAGVEISQAPLVVSGGVADNLVLLPSVEWPTINSVANLGNYAQNTAYVGYFDAGKCYSYHYSNTESDRYFYPSDLATNHTCSTSEQYWSGNFLNWAATQTIDPFRSSMTGGYRVKDTTTETWLEKARHDGQGSSSIFPDRRLPVSGSDNTLVKKTTPFDSYVVSSKKKQTVTDVDYIQMRIQGLGNKMRFSLNNTNATSASSVTAYDPATHTRTTGTDASTVYEISIRVKVCVPGILETNCVAYGNNYKPEGLMQEYASRLRYSIFGYLNDSVTSRDGAALRTKQKSIGPMLANLNSEVEEDNPNKEWDAATGILIQNPDSQDAADTNTKLGINTIKDSGAINYLNKFGQMTSQNHKSYDPVGEMYYAGLRYIRNLGNVAAYSTISSSASSTAKYDYADGFPIITNWGDPYQASCQSTALLGIGDINTHRDKNLPGNTSYRTDEPTMPTEVAADNINVVALTNKVGQMEGLGNIGNTNSFSGRNNSAYMAGMAWYANTKDLRPETNMPGTQSAATYWVDVMEGQVLGSMNVNQYALAAKYGGFNVPEGVDFNPDTWSGALPETWWWTNGQTLTQPSTDFKRPDNFFIAGQAAEMVENLKLAFDRIVNDILGSGASLASVSSKLTTGSRIYQTVYFSRSWNGDIYAFDINPTTGKFSSTSTWKASQQLPVWSSRNIFMRNDKRFHWDNLSTTEKTALGSAEVVDYLRGDASHEQKNGGSLRNRVTPLGDMIQSQAVIIGKPDDNLYVGKIFSGAADHKDFAAARSGRTGTLYVGGNDGMLHGFNAQTGEETFAFVPSTTLPAMRELANKAYEHRYFVDGEVTAADIYTQGAWKTILLATLGRGGKAIFALDVTDPEDVKFLWEKNVTDIPALGNNLGKPLIAQTADGTWQAVLGNGMNSTGDKAQLIMVNIETKDVTVMNTGVGSNNGLTAVAGWSAYGDSIATDFYAGDMNGNLWRFPANGSNNSSPVKLFTAKDKDNNPQPITAAPLSGKDPLTGKVWVFFGTGKYLAEADITTTAPQTWYGLKDEGNLITRSDLLERKTGVEGVLDGYDVRVIEAGLASDVDEWKGWYIDLPTEGERIVVPNFFQADALVGTSRIPNGTDICTPTGKGFIMAINPFPGARLGRVFFDLNDDALFNDEDKLTIDEIPTIVSGVGFGSSPHNPIFIDNLMQVVSDNGSIAGILTQGFSGVPTRTSWREIINQ